LRNVLARTPARLVLPVVLMAAAAGAAQAQQPAEQPQAQQREHTVRSGDTLWDLARTYLGNPFSWPAIFEANRAVIDKPHRIYPAERLVIPPLLQQLQEEPGGYPLQPELETAPAAAGGTAPAVIREATPAAAREATLPPTVVATVDMRTPVISAGQYLAAPWLRDATVPLPAAMIARKADPAATQGRLAATLLPNERVHVLVAGLAAGVGDTLVVVRPGRQLATWGQVMEPLGLLRVESAMGGEASARLVGQFGDARVGDLVMRKGPIPQLEAGEPQRVADGPQGLLLEFLSSEPLYGVGDIAFLSLGRADGVGIGDEFAVYVPMASPLPAEQVGVVRVVRTGERTSTVRVVAVTSTALGDGLPVKLIRKMP
jgi:hypothetical protein